MFCAEPGMLLANFDLSQAESWVVAYLAREERMQDALANGDIHTETAGNALFFADVECEHFANPRLWHKVGSSATCSKCNNTITEAMRYTGKRLNHASSYGMSPYQFAAVVNKESDKPPYVTISYEQAKRYSESWHRYYSVKPWWEEIKNQLNINRTLVTPYGRKRTFFANWGDELFKEAYAFIPQSTVADHFNGATQPELGIKGGLLEVYRQLQCKDKILTILNQSHDSCLVTFRSEYRDDIISRVIPLLRRPIVIRDKQFTIPVDCEVGERWGELEKVKLAS